MNASDRNSRDYQERVVAFIDVLGFAELVRASDTDPTKRDKIAKFIMTDKLFADFTGNMFRMAAAFFSDSFVLSIGSDRVFYLIREAGYLCRHLLLQGFPCRGAITTGSLYHQERIVVGPAFVKAYQLEQSVAIYPRVILDDATMQWWKHEFRPGSAHPHFESLVKRDRDGQHFIDIFNPGWSEFLRWTEFIPSTDSVPIDPAEFLKGASA